VTIYHLSQNGMTNGIRFFVKALMVDLERRFSPRTNSSTLLRLCYRYSSSPCKLAALYNVPGMSDIWSVLLVMLGGRADARLEFSLQVDVLCSRVGLSGSQSSAETSNKSDMLCLWKQSGMKTQPKPHHISHLTSVTRTQNPHIPPCRL
jgi:hypothetical protein